MIANINILFEPKIKQNDDNSLLKSIYEELQTKNYNIVTVKKIEVCASPAGCVIKNKNTKTSSPKFVAMKMNNKEIRSSLANDHNVYVRLVVSGELKQVKGVVNFSMRFFKNGKITVQIGLKNLKIGLNANCDEYIEKEIVSKIKPFIENISKKSMNSSLSLITFDGNVFGHDKEIQNFNDIYENKLIPKNWFVKNKALGKVEKDTWLNKKKEELFEMGKNFEIKSMINGEKMTKTEAIRLLKVKIKEYRNEISNKTRMVLNKYGLKKDLNKRISVAYYCRDKACEDKRLPRVSLSRYGSIQIFAKNCDLILSTFQIFQKHLNSSSTMKYMNFKNNKKATVVKQSKTNTQCAKRNPALSNKGRCPSGFYPKPKLDKKTGKVSVCCYKGKGTKRHAKMFVNLNLEIPEQLKEKSKNNLVSMNFNQLKLTSIEPVIGAESRAHFLFAKLKAAKVKYNDKLIIDLKNLKIISGTQLVNIAKKLGIFQEGLNKTTLAHEICTFLRVKMKLKNFYGDNTNIHKVFNLRTLLSLQKTKVLHVKQNAVSKMSLKQIANLPLTEIETPSKPILKAIKGRLIQEGVWKSTDYDYRSRKHLLASIVIEIFHLRSKDINSDKKGKEVNYNIKPVKTKEKKTVKKAYNNTIPIPNLKNSSNNNKNKNNNSNSNNKNNNSNSNDNNNYNILG